MPKFPDFLAASRRLTGIFSAAILLGLSCAAGLPGAQAFYPLADVRPGLHGIGRTVFSGDRIETFDVEILGVLHDIGPRQAIILARLSGGPLAQTGILQGMSGSPVYIDGKLLGAVALGFPFSKEPLAGIQPIESMLSFTGGLTTPAPSVPIASTEWQFFRNPAPSIHVPASSVSTPFGSLTNLLTPLSLAGFTPATLQTLATRFEALGFAPLQGLASAPASLPAQTSGVHAADLVPGSMISVGLLTGDMNITADGTVTYIDGKRVYAFGHRFLDTGSTEMPFACSDVVALVPNVNTSFKLSAPRQWVGSILSDRASAIAGEIGRSAHTVPMTITLQSSSTGSHDYHFQVVNDRFLTPFIVQTALFSVLDATERTLGRGTLELSGDVEWDANVPPLHIRDTFVSDSQLAPQVSSDAVVPLGFVLSAGFDTVHLKALTFRLKASESKRLFHLAQAWTSTHDVRPGDSVSINTLLEGENGGQLSRSINYRIPNGALAGPLNFTISDANTLNFPEFAGLSPATLRTPQELIQTINSFRDNDAIYVRVWRQEPSFTIAGPSPAGEISDPPPSIALILADPSNSATSNTALTLIRGSEVAELAIPARGFVISGAKTLQVEVKE